MSSNVIIPVFVTREVDTSLCILQPSLRSLQIFMTSGSVLRNHGSFSELMAKIFGMEVMQDFLCRDSLVKRNQRLYRGPFASLSFLILGIHVASLSLSVIIAVGITGLILERVLQTM